MSSNRSLSRLFNLIALLSLIVPLALTPVEPALARPVVPEPAGRPVPAAQGDVEAAAVAAGPTPPDAYVPFEAAYGPGPVAAVAYSPDGKRGLIGSGGNYVLEIDLATGAPVRYFQGRGWSVNAVAYSPDGTRVVAGTGRNTAMMWDAATGEALRLFDHGYGWGSSYQYSYSITSLSLSQNGSTLVTVGDCAYFVWNVNTGELIRRAGSRSQGCIEQATIAPDGASLVTGDQRGNLELLSVATGEPVLGIPIEAHQGTVEALAFSPDGTRILSGGRDLHGKDVSYLWARNGELLQVFRQPEPPEYGYPTSVKSAGFSPDGSRVVTTNGAGRAWVWNAANGQLVGAFGEWQTTTTSSESDRLAVFSPDGSRLLVGGPGAASLWEVATGQLVRTVEGHASQVTALAISPDGNQVATGDLEGRTILWTRGGKRLHRLQGHSRVVSGYAQAGVNDIAFSPGGQIVATAGADGTLRFWDAVSGAALSTLPHGAAVTSVAFSADGRRIATGSEDGARLWDTATGALLRTFTHVENDYTYPITSVAISPDGSRVLGGGKWRVEAWLWDANNGSLLHTLAHEQLADHAQGRVNGITAVAFTPDGNQVVTAAGGDNKIRIWDAGTGAAGQTFDGPPARRSGDNVTYYYIASLDLSTDGSRLMGAGTDGLARVWDLRDGQIRRTVVAVAPAAALSADGRAIAGAGYNGAVHLWSAVAGMPLRTIPYPEESAGSSPTVFSPNGQRLLYNGHVIELSSGRIIQSLGSETVYLGGAVFSPDGEQVLAFPYSGNAVQLWDVTSGQVVRTFQATGAHLLTFAADGRRVVVAGDNNLQLFDTATEALLQTFPTETRVLAFSVDGARALTMANDGAAFKVWDTTSGRLIRTIAVYPGTEGLYYVFSPDGSKLLVGHGGYEGLSGAVVWAWNVETGEQIGGWVHPADAQPLGFAAGGRLAAVTAGGTTYLWDTASGELALTLPLGSFAAISADGSLFLESGGDAMRFWSFDWSPWSARRAVALTLGTTVGGQAPPFSWADYSVTATAGQSLLIQVTPTTAGQSLWVYGRQGQMPALAFADQYARSRTPRGTYELLVTPSQDGTYYAGVFSQGADARAFNIVARAVSRHLSNVTPPRAGNAGQATLALSGLGFVDGMQVELRRAGAATLKASEVTRLSPTELRASFHLAGAAVGDYALHAIWPNGTQPEGLPSAVTVGTGTGSRLQSALSVPSTIRPARPYTARITYANTGDADIVAPLFLLHSSDTRVSYKTACDAGWGAGPLQVLGVNPLGPAGTLPAGVGGSIAVKFQVEGATTGESFPFQLKVMEANDAPVDWAAYKAGMKPAAMTAAEWDAIWPALQTRLGATWGDYLRLLGRNAEVLRRQGRPAECVATLLEMEIKQLLGEPAGAIAGRLLDGETGAALSGMTITAVSSDGATARLATSNLVDGGFVIEGLPAGTYELAVDGHHLSPVVTATLASGQQSTGQLLHAYPLAGVEEDVSPPPEKPAYAPRLTTDDSGKVHLVWQYGQDLWHGVYAGGAWTDTKSLGPTAGEADLAFSPALGGTEPGLIAVWKDGTGKGARLRYSVGRTAANGKVQWTAAQDLTSDEHGDAFPVVTTLGNGSSLVLWLQRSQDVEDDLDLYYTTISDADIAAAGAPLPGGVVEGASLTSEVGAIMATRAAGPAQLPCVGRQISKQSITIPDKVPFIGGKYSEEIYANFCFTPDSLPMCGATGAITGDVSIKMPTGSRRERGYSGEFRGDGLFATDPNACRYIFKGAQAQAKFTIRDTVYSPPTPIIIGLVPIAVVQGALSLYGELGATLGWVGTGFPALPNKMKGTLDFGGGLEGKAALPIRPEIDIVSGKLGKVFVRTGFSESGFYLNSFCVKLDFEGKAGLWKVQVKAPEWGDCATPTPWLADTGFLAAAGIDPVVGATATLTEPVVTLTYDPLVGTGAVYEGQPVLAGSITQDLADDGRPSVAGGGGETLVAWTKDAPAGSGNMGSAVVVAGYNGSGWSAPVEVHSVAHFNNGAALAFENGTTPMLLWASAPATVTHTTPGAQVLDAMSNTDIFFSRRVGGVWTEPAPVGVLPGTDTGVRVKASATGRPIAVWNHIEAGNNRLYAAIWYGSGWSVSSVPIDGYVDSYDVTESDGKVMLVWSQDSDGDPVTTNDRVLFYAFWDGSYNWSTLERMAKPIVAPATNYSELGAIQALEAAFALPSPPKDCCKDPDDDGDAEPPDDDLPEPPVPPGGIDLPDPEPGPQPVMRPAGSGETGVVLAADPNEKVGPLGTGPTRSVGASDTLEYTIHFENVPTATAPAQEVFIYDQLDPNLDWSTFRFLDVNFDETVAAASGESPYQFYTRQTVADHRPGVDKTWWVDIFGEMDPASGMVRWIYRTLDPETGEWPEDALAGFLPPEDKSGRGQGYVRFSIKPKADTPAGTRISNAATIVFDTNESIATNEAWNTIGGPGGVYLPMVRK